MIGGWSIGGALMSEYDADGFMGVQYDAEGEAASGVIPYEAHSFGGLIHRPLDPVVDAGGVNDPSRTCNLLIGMQGGKGHAFVLEDPRVIPKLPAARPGETIAHSDFGSFTRWHADGSITSMTTDKGGDPAGQSVYFKIEPTAFRWVAPFGQLTWNQSVYRLLTQSGASLTLGAIGGLPAPLDAVNSYVRLEAAMIELSAQVVTIGALGGGVPSNAAKSDPLLAVLGTIATSLQTIAAALVSASPTSGITPVQTAAVTAAVVAASAAVGAAPALIKSSLMVS